MQGVPRHGEHQERPDACKALFGLSMVSLLCEFCNVLLPATAPSSRRPWFNKFRGALSSTASVEEVEYLLRVKVERWRGKRPRSLQGQSMHDDHAETEESSCESEAFDCPLGEITSQSWPLEFVSGE